MELKDHCNSIRYLNPAGFVMQIMLCGVELKEVKNSEGSQVVAVTRKQEMQVVTETVTVASSAVTSQPAQQPAAASNSRKYPMARIFLLLSYHCSIMEGALRVGPCYLPLSISVLHSLVNFCSLWLSILLDQQTILISCPSDSLGTIMKFGSEKQYKMLQYTVCTDNHCLSFSYLSF